MPEPDQVDSFAPQLELYIGYFSMIDLVSL